MPPPSRGLAGRSARQHKAPQVLDGLVEHIQGRFDDLAVPGWRPAQPVSMTKNLLVDRSRSNTPRFPLALMATDS
jgi:hypothetical protein